MQLIHEPSISVISKPFAIVAWTTALVVVAIPVAQAACIITLTPEPINERERRFKEFAVQELAGGRKEPQSCSRSTYHLSTDQFPYSVPTSESRRPPVTPTLTHPRTKPRERNLYIVRSFGFRYPGFLRVYSGNGYTGSTKIYSGPRFTNATPVPRPRYSGFRQVYSSHRYAGFARTYTGPRYQGTIAPQR